MASPPTSRTISVNVPMALTWARIAMIPLVVGIFYLPDSWLAPHWKTSPAAGYSFSPPSPMHSTGISRAGGAWPASLASFLIRLPTSMVSAALIVLLSLGRVDSFVALVIIGREIAVSALREWMAKIGKSSSVAVNSMGKIKTISQMVAIPMLLFHDRLFGIIDLHLIGTLLIYMAAVDDVLDADLLEACMASFERARIDFAILRALVRE